MAVEAPQNAPRPESPLTRFQIDLLVAIRDRQDAGERLAGLDIFHELETEFGYTQVNHGRGYPNLDTLAAEGLIEKGEIDRRSNSHEITEKGRTVLRERARLLGEGGGDG